MVGTRRRRLIASCSLEDIDRDLEGLARHLEAALRWAAWPRLLPGGLVDPPTPGPLPSAPPAPTPAPTPPLTPPRRAVPTLSRKYTHEGATWTVDAFEVAPNDPGLPPGAPWALFMADLATRTHNFIFDPNHPIFNSITMTPRDGLLLELSVLTVEMLRTSRLTPDMAAILAAFRENYGEETLLDPRGMSADAAEMLVDLAKAMVASCPEGDRAALFNELVVTDQQSVMRALAARKIMPTTVTSDGSFLQYAPYEILRGIVEARPELCFDGRIWEEPYASLDYGNSEITDAVRQGVLAKYVGLINDAILLARQERLDFVATSRDELVRAMMSLRLLRPDREVG